MDYDKLKDILIKKIEQELSELFPNTKVFRMDNDTTTTKSSHAKILGEFEKTKPAILVGTQMIAKGHDFPSVTLVGILDADLSLFYSDFKANEKTFQLVTQVAGRAGRAEKEGKVVLQTFFPKHYVYNFCSLYHFENSLIESIDSYFFLFALSSSVIWAKVLLYP